MRIAIFGGTYNPVHIGHIFLAKEVKYFLKVDKLIFVPTHTPSHKIIKDNIKIHDRTNMLKLATEHEEGMLVDKCDIINGGISYTVDTISCIKKRYSGSSIYLVIGDDLFEHFGTWKNPDSILENVDLVVAHRIYQNKLESPYKHIYINNKILPISSFEIRERIKKGCPVDYLVPENVLKYIRTNKLYLKD